MASRSSHILAVVFGPKDWAYNAARALSCGRRYAYKLARGEYVMTRRHWNVLAAVGQARQHNLELERIRRKAAIDLEYNNYLSQWSKAEQEISQQLERFRQERVRKGAE